MEFVLKTIQNMKFLLATFQKLLKPLKDLEIEHAKNNSKNKIMISLNSKHNLEREEYKLIIRDRECITLEASHESGLFYGFQSFRQLCDPKLEKGLRPQNSLFLLAKLQIALLLVIGVCI